MCEDEVFGLKLNQIYDRLLENVSVSEQTVAASHLFKKVERWKCGVWVDEEKERGERWGSFVPLVVLR